MGIANMAKGLNGAYRRTKEYAVRVLLERIAGQGATVGANAAVPNLRRPDPSPSS